MKRQRETITLKIKASKPSVGHQANTHQVHEDRRTKRQRTRAAVRRAALREWSR